jgi:hypothetical protein
VEFGFSRVDDRLSFRVMDDDGDDAGGGAGALDQECSARVGEP